jgi:nitrite reductase/ring-hydroxylating ferredoxin subunit
MVCGGTAALGAAAAWPLAAYVGSPPSAPLPDYVVIPPADYQLEPGESRFVAYGPIPALLLRPPETGAELRVFVGICTHLDCNVGYSREQNCILCACHEGSFDVDGNVLSPPPTVPLRTFHTAHRGADLVIALEKENLEKALQEVAAT